MPVAWKHFVWNVATQGALAARASISGNHYQEIAYARTNPTLTVMRLAAALDVPLANVCEPVGTAPGERMMI